MSGRVINEALWWFLFEDLQGAADIDICDYSRNGKNMGFWKLP